VVNEDIDDLGARRENHIGGGLDYACRSWANHLQFASGNDNDVEHAVGLVEHFFEHHLLSWLEVLSIGGDMRCAVYSLRDVKRWFVHVSVATLLVTVL
jgi:predicted SAM-dependent methyltransferase